MRNFFSGPVTLSRGAMIIAVVALCVALTGGAYAANKIGKNAVQAKNIANGAVSLKKLTPGTMAKAVKFTAVAGATVTVSGTESKSASATCPTGATAISGGAELTNPLNNANNSAIVGSQRDANGKGWTTRVESFAGGGKSYTANAVCVTLKP